MVQFSFGATTTAFLPGTVSVTDKEAFEDVIFSGQIVAPTDTVTSAAVDVGNCSKISVLMSATDNMTIYPQFSDDNLNFYDLKTAADANVTFNCNNEKICMPIDVHGHYFRIVAKNFGSGNSTVNAVIASMV